MPFRFDDTDAIDETMGREEGVCMTVSRAKTCLLEVMDELDQTQRTIAALESRLGEKLEELRVQAKVIRRLEKEVAILQGSMT